MSKGLEAFNRLIKFLNSQVWEEDLPDTYNQDYFRVEKELKALEILMELIDFEVDLYNHNLITDLGTIGFINADIDTIKKLELLKEVKENDK